MDTFITRQHTATGRPEQRSAMKAIVEIGLFHPAPQAAVGDPEVRGGLCDRFLAHPGQLDSTPTKLRRVWTGHLDFLPGTTTVASESVFETSATASAP